MVVSIPGQAPRHSHHALL